MKMLLSLFFSFFLLVIGPGWSEAWASQEEAVQDNGIFDLSRFAIGVKGSLHTFWSEGFLADPAEYGRPGLSASDLMGLGGELDLDYFLRDYLILTVTGGGYRGSSDKEDVSLYTGYGLLTVKLVNTGRVADYYAGVGGGGYWSRLQADGSATALKPGMHALLGIRCRLGSSGWSVVFEDRLAWTVKAKGGFGGLDLAGNFALLGCTYRF